VLGARGQRPAVVESEDYRALTVALNSVPGLDAAPWPKKGIAGSWDAVAAVHRLTGLAVPEVPEHPEGAFANKDEFECRFGEYLRPYQRADAVWLANRPWAYLANPMRTGKSFTALAAATLSNRKRILVICPSMVKWVWGDECARWLDESALILEGLSGRDANLYCTVCKQSGRTPEGAWCPACRARNGSSYGYRIQDIRDTEPPTKRQAEQGQTDWACRKHPDVRSPAGSPEVCSKCKDEMVQALMSRRMTVVNYEILKPQGRADEFGRIQMPDNMRGWARILKLVPWDLVIIDEAHTLRTFDTVYKNRGKRIADFVKAIADSAPYVWALSGTPIFGYVRDLWPQLDLISKGLWGSAVQFTERYCEGHHGEWGWEAKGKSNVEELQTRLNVCMKQRKRKDLNLQLPAKQRRVHYIEGAKPLQRRKTTGAPSSVVAKLIDQVAPMKHDVVIPFVLQELAEGMKVYVLTFRPKHAERFQKKLTEQMNKKQWRSRMNEARAETFLGQTERGISPKARKMICKSFTDHAGAACFIATIGSMPGGASLKGVTSTHFIDFDVNPSAMEQAEDRGYEDGSTGYVVTHYVAKGSIDDHLASVVLPKFRAKDEVLGEENSRNMVEAFDQKETLEEVLRRHTAHLRKTSDDDEETY